MRYKMSCGETLIVTEIYKTWLSYGTESHFEVIFFQIELNSPVKPRRRRDSACRYTCLPF